MGKLIDAERFKNEDLVFSDGHISDDLKLYVKYAEVVEAIERTPAVDAVPVVRCKDCKLMSECFPSGGNLVNGKLWCAWWNNITEPEVYCSMGERREGDAVSVED